MAAERMMAYVVWHPSAELRFFLMLSSCVARFSRNLPANPLIRDQDSQQPIQRNCGLTGRRRALPRFPLLRLSSHIYNLEVLRANRLPDSITYVIPDLRMESNIEQQDGAMTQLDISSTPTSQSPCSNLATNSPRANHSKHDANPHADLEDQLRFPPEHGATWALTQRQHLCDQCRDLVIAPAAA